jgi:hypothetical protein
MVRLPFIYIGYRRETAWRSKSLSIELFGLEKYCSGTVGKTPKI